MGPHLFDARSLCQGSQSQAPLRPLQKACSCTTWTVFARPGAEHFLLHKPSPRSWLSSSANPLACREAHTALAMDGLKVGDRQIRCSLAKSDQRPALPPPPQAMPMLGQPFNLMQAQAQARLMQQLPAFNMLLGPLPGVQAPPVVDSRGKAAQRPPQDPDRVARTIFVESVADNMNEQVGGMVCSLLVMPQP